MPTSEPPFKSPPDRFGFMFPDGAMFDVTDSARLFGQDPEARARTMAAKCGGRAVRIITKVVDLDA
jgi:hypothetical protein